MLDDHATPLSIVRAWIMPAKLHVNLERAVFSRFQKIFYVLSGTTLNDREIELVMRELSEQELRRRLGKINKQGG